MDKSQIHQFYNNQRILITGGTGFMGQVLIEKLLRSTNCVTIYVLIRKKKGKDPHTRLEEVLNNVLFGKLLEKCPSFKSRLKPISGDCTFKNLDLDPENSQLLKLNVNVVFHVAAAVRFNENIRVAYDINVKGTVNLVDFCQQMKQLKSFVHVSTAYSNCLLDRIDEIFYKPPIDYEDLEKILETSPTDASITEEWPNTYTFTKNLAEDAIRKKAGQIPIGIFRPSIVLSTYKEPLEGWTNNYGGITGIVTSVALGILRVFPSDVDVSAEIVPVDKAIAALIASAWDIHNEHKQNPAKIPIYNFTTMNNSPTWYEIGILCLNQMRRYPLSNALWSPRVTIMKTSRNYQMMKIIYDYIPALVADAATFGLLSFFTERRWIFVNKNMRKVWCTMNQEDKELFPFDMSQMLWLQFFHTYYKGLRIYLLKDPLDTLPEAKIRAQRLEIGHNSLLFLLCFLGMNLLGSILLMLL